MLSIYASFVDRLFHSIMLHDTTDHRTQHLRLVDGNNDEHKIICVILHNHNLQDASYFEYHIAQKAHPVERTASAHSDDNALKHMVVLLNVLYGFVISVLVLFHSFVI